MTDTFRCGHPKTPENTRWKANSRGGKEARCWTCLRAYERERLARTKPLNFTAEWPIEDPARTESELIAEAEADLRNVAPKAHRITRREWTVDGDTLRLRGYAYSTAPPPTKLGERLPAAPLLDYARHRLHRLSHKQRESLNSARLRGYVTVNAADQLAVALGTHPGLLWAEWWLPVEEEAA